MTHAPPAPAGARAYDLIVLGAGVVGACTAYWAQRAGLRVAVIERAGEPAMETSHANGGQISVSHAAPWATPAAPPQALRWLFDPQAPLRVAPRAEPAQWLWLAAFLRNCTPARARFHARQAIRLAAYSRDTLAALNAAEALDYRRRQTGILHIYRRADSVAAAVPMAALMRELGCQRTVLSIAEAVAREPALADAAPKLAGATYTTGDETGDARVFTQALMRLIAERGGDVRYNTVALGLDVEAGAVQSVRVEQDGRAETLRARHVVVCLGVEAARFLRPFGLALPIYPVKGYSLTIPLAQTNAAPVTALIDDENKVVYANLHNHLRVAGMAEVRGADRRLDARRVARLKDIVRDTFPGLAGPLDAATAWTGLRPMTPSSLPFIQRSPRHDNLWLNTGHGSLGWTMAAGSGALLTDLILGRTPQLDYRRVP